MGVPFGLSISDITKGIKLAHDIYERCSNEQQSASVKYQQFLNDIRILGNTLERLQGVVARYEDRYGHQQWQQSSHGRDAADRFWPQLTGDFYTTLKECDALLKRHKYLQSGRNNLTNNIRFLTSEGTLDNLTAKLRFHIEKVSFYTRPAEFDAIVRNGSELQQLKAQVEQLKQLLVNGPGQSQSLSATVLSQDLKARFLSEFQTRPPSWSADGTEWPLKEAFEALRFHFGAGTITFHPGPDRGDKPTLMQYINLLKALWIIDNIKQSHQYMAASSESVWAHRMIQCEDDVRGQLHRFEAGDLDRPSEYELLELPDQYFATGKDEEKATDPLKIEVAGPLEEKILEIKLASDAGNTESALLIFRESETDFRLVESTTQAGTLVAQYDKETELHMERNRLVPIYALPREKASLRHNLIIFNERGKKPKELNFLSHDDVKKVQRALTNFRVHHDMAVARWCINGSESGSGIVQLWQYKPLPPVATANMSTGSDRASSIGSPGLPSPGVFSTQPLREAVSSAVELNAQGSGPVDYLGWSEFPEPPPLSTVRSRTSQASPTAEAHRRWTSFSGTTNCDSIVTQTPPRGHTGKRPSIVSGTSVVTQSSVLSPVRGPRSGGTQLVKPVLPVLVLFTSYKSRYSFFQLILDQSIFVNPRSCGCRNPKRHCTKVVLESKKGRFNIQYHSADQEDDRGLDSWDISIFRHPRAGKYQNIKSKEKVGTLELQFASEEEKNEFLVELTALENNRTTNDRDYERALVDKKGRAKAVT